MSYDLTWTEILILARGAGFDEAQCGALGPRLERFAHMVWEFSPKGEGSTSQPTGEGECGGECEGECECESYAEDNLVAYFAGQALPAVIGLAKYELASLGNSELLAKLSDRVADVAFTIGRNMASRADDEAFLG